MNVINIFIYDSKDKKKQWAKYYPEIKIPDEYRLYIHMGLLCANADKKVIAYASRYFDIICFFDIEGNLLKKHYFSDIKMPVLSRDFKGVANESTIYFTQIYGTTSTCYFLCILKSATELLGMLNGNINTTLLAFDWDGNLKNSYQLDFLPISFCVDSEDKKMYCIVDLNIENDFSVNLCEINLK